MQHGKFITELEFFAREGGYAFSHSSLAVLVSQIDFAKLEQFPAPKRQQFYSALMSDIIKERRGTEQGLQIFGETDASHFLEGMRNRAGVHKLFPDIVRDIWCLIYIGGCP